MGSIYGSIWFAFAGAALGGTLVTAGQLSPWHMEEAVSHRLFAQHIEELTARLERSEVLSG